MERMQEAKQHNSDDGSVTKLTRRGRGGKRGRGGGGGTPSEGETSTSVSRKRSNGRRDDGRHHMETTNDGYSVQEQELENNNNRKNDEDDPVVLFSTLSCTDLDVSRDYIERAEKRSQQHEDGNASTATLVEIALDILYSSSSVDRAYIEDRHEGEEEGERDIRRAQDLEFERSAAEDSAKDRARLVALQEKEYREKVLRETLEAKSRALAEFRRSASENEEERKPTVMFREPDGERFVHSFGCDATLQTVFDTLDVERRKYAPGSYDLVRNEPPMKTYREDDVETKNTNVRELDKTAVFIALR